jgi:hypothetical protein
MGFDRMGDTLTIQILSQNHNCLIDIDLYGRFLFFLSHSGIKRTVYSRHRSLFIVFMVFNRIYRMDSSIFCPTASSNPLSIFENAFSSWPGILIAR